VTPDRRKLLFSSWNMGHLSIRGGRCVVSNETYLSLVDLTGAGVTPLLAHGIRDVPPRDDPTAYDYQAQGNLTPDGTALCFMTNKDRGGANFDAYVLEL
jgi:hypothetical protein